MTDKNKKMQGHHDRLQIEINKSPEIVVRKRVSKPMELLEPLTDQPAPLQTANMVTTPIIEGGNPVYTKLGGSVTPPTLIGSKEFPICKGRDPRGWRINCEPHIGINPTLQQQLLGVSTQQSAKIVRT